MPELNSFRVGNIVRRWFKCSGKLETETNKDSRKKKPERFYIKKKTKQNNIVYIKNRTKVRKCT